MRKIKLLIVLRTQQVNFDYFTRLVALFMVRINNMTTPISKNSYVLLYIFVDNPSKIHTEVLILIYLH